MKQWPKGGPNSSGPPRGWAGGSLPCRFPAAHIYTCGNVAEHTTVAAIDLEGKTLWQVPVGDAWEGAHAGTRSTPTIDDGRLFVETPSGDLVSLNAETGKEIWRLNILKKFDAKNIKWALAESPLVDGPHVICGPGGPQTAVVALDKKTARSLGNRPPPTATRPVTRRRC